MTVSRINQPLARWSVNYRVAFLNRLATQTNEPTLTLTGLRHDGALLYGRLTQTRDTLVKQRSALKSGSPTRADCRSSGEASFRLKPV